MPDLVWHWPWFVMAVAHQANMSSTEKKKKNDGLWKDSVPLLYNVVLFIYVLFLFYHRVVHLLDTLRILKKKRFCLKMERIKSKWSQISHVVCTNWANSTYFNSDSASGPLVWTRSSRRKQVVQTIMWSASPTVQTAPQASGSADRRPPEWLKKSSGRRQAAQRWHLRWGCFGVNKIQSRGVWKTL